MYSDGAGQERDLANLNGAERARYVQGMFTRIARRYDLMNRVMTGGQDVNWRKEVIRRAPLPPGALLLDLGAGAGDLARQALRQQPAGRAVAADFTLAMMQVGQERIQPASPESGRLGWAGADACHLPFPDETFEALVSGFLLRNVVDLRRSLAEQYRVLKPGGWWAALDTTPPRRNLLYPLIQFHLHTVIPTLGRLLTGQADAYTYLPDSTEGFLPPERLAARLLEAGFQNVGFQRRMFDTIAIYWGQKPPQGALRPRSKRALNETEGGRQRG
jgi:demethylmenaquinone methyltransferase/2-methoxy-6-polyprenyl-1,4-benzoquinol methylase